MDRERAMEDLKRGRLQIVVTTDQAARGLELAGVTHVVNFDVPPSPEDYVHRIGRAGRPDAQGDAFTLMSPEEQRHLAGIERFVGRAVPRVLLPDFNYGLKPNQLQQQAIYDDEQARARRAAMAKLGFAVVRQMPTTAHGGFRPVTPQGKPLAAARPKPAGKSGIKVARSGGNGGKPRTPATTRTRVAASARPATPARPPVFTATPTRIVLPARPVAPVRAATPVRATALAASARTKPAARSIKAKVAARPGSKRHKKSSG